MARIIIILLLCLALSSLVVQEGDAIFRRRRRRCFTWSWGPWGTCSSGTTCSTGVRYRNRGANCGTNKVESGSCTGLCCTYTPWADFTSCQNQCTDYGSKLQTRSTNTFKSGCVNYQTRYISCGGKCGQPCTVNGWGSWTACGSGCSTLKTQYRYRSISQQAIAPSTCNYNTQESKVCPSSCCPTNCLQNAWSNWGGCSSSCGAGTTYRYRSITRNAACKGAGCGSNSDSKSCSGSGSSTNCQMNSWGSWGGCNAASCSYGSQYRYRSVRVNPSCGGSSCPSTTSSRTCGSCCPKNCVWSGYSSWSTCDATCGSGQRFRYRSVSVSQSCGGSCSGSGTQSATCTRYVKTNCVVSQWSAYKPCTATCGTGTKTRTRSVSTQASCGGTCTDPLTDTVSCTQYIKKACTASSWGTWSTCSSQCSVGTQIRQRTITVPAECSGPCPEASNLKETRACGTANGGCDQVCISGVCSCNAGYVLTATKKTCTPRSCGTPVMSSYCPAGATCFKPSVTCTGYTYTQKCSLGCSSSKYIVKGGSSELRCLSSGAWTDHSQTYCGLLNAAPTSINLGANSINENSPAGTTIGDFNTVDPNPGDTFSYSLTNSAGGKFIVTGNKLQLNFAPNYEKDPKSYSITVKSTDNGGLSVSGSFTVHIKDINEKPTSCKLAASQVDENPTLNTVAGTLSSVDEDPGQSFTYKLLDNANGRFKLSGNKVLVALSRTKCLSDGYAACVYNYEKTPSIPFIVRSTDNGSPPQYRDCTLSVALTDINDQPRNLRLNGYTLKEGAPIGTRIGSLQIWDEDVGQTFTYSLIDDDNGRFKIDQNLYLVNARVANYATGQSHQIIIQGTDNGNPNLSVQRLFTITVLDVNQAPVKITLQSTGSALTYAVDTPTIKESSLLNTVLGTVYAKDADANAKLTYTLDNNAGGRFAIDTKTTHCSVLTGTPGFLTQCESRIIVTGKLNHEVDALHTIVVRVTDEHGLFAVQKFTVKILDINDSPHDITTTGAVQIKENKNNAIITTFQTSDQDPAHTHTYKLTGDPSGKFKIDGSRLMTTATADLNYEAQSSYTIIVQSTDNGSPALSFSKTFVVTVLDVNEVPAGVVVSYDVDENSALNTVVGQITVKDPDNLKSVRQSFTYLLKDSASSRFKLAGDQIQVATPNVDCLKFGGAYCKLNYEADKTHSIDIQVTDDGSPPLSSNFQLTITLNNINDQPRSLAMNNTVVKENEPAGTLVGGFTFTDEDTAQMHTIKLVDSDSGQFQLSGDGSALLKAKAANYETKTTHKVTVEVMDNGSPPMLMRRDFQITVLNVNEAPVVSIFTDTAGQQTFLDNHASITENSKLGTVVGTIEATDPDANQQLVFSLDDDATGLFAIAPRATCTFTKGSRCTAVVTVAGSLNHEGGKQEKIIVRATDTAGHFAISTFNIVVIDVNDPPYNITLAGGNPSVRENNPDAYIGALDTNDDDLRQTFTYTLLSNANGRFKLVNYEIYAIGSFNYEQTPSFTIRVRSTDSGTPPLSVEEDFVIPVIDVNEKPSQMHVSSNQVDENSAADTVVGKLTVTDPDNSKKIWQTFSYSLVDTAGGRFEVDGDEIKVRTSNVACLAVGGTSCWLNYEQQMEHSLVVKVTDSGSPPLSVDFFANITLKNINDRPRDLKISGFKVHENQPVGTVVGKFSGTDEDIGQHLSYSLDNDDYGRFKIVGTDLQKAQQANYETNKSHTIVVTMSDDGTPSLNITKTFTIEVLDVVEAPVSTDFLDTSGQLTFTKNSPLVEENSVKGTIIGTLFSVDPDYKQTLKYQLDDDANGLFSLDPAVTCKAVTDTTGHHSSCEVFLLVNGVLDYETTRQHDIVVRATDQDGKFNVERFTIVVVDANDIPHDIILLSNTINENAEDVFISDFNTLDADKTHSHTYTLVTNPGNQFAIVNNGLYSATTATLNYEAQQTWNITIRSTDDGTPPEYFDEEFVIDVQDINERPTKTNITGNTVKENSPRDTVVGELLVTDPDNDGPKGRWQTATCIATDNADGTFYISSNIVKVAQPGIDYEMNSSFSMTVKCTDSGSPPLSLTTTFTIDVTNVNEAPSGIYLNNDEIPENMPAGTVIGVLNTTDPDNANTITQTFTYSLVNPDPKLPFSISGDDLVTTRPLDFETRKSWAVEVKSTDPGGLSATHTYQINVTNVNEPPTGFLLLSAATVPENTPKGSFVGDVVAEDPDAYQDHTFRVLGVAAGIESNTSVPDANLSNAFNIDPVTGNLTVDNVTFNYETAPHYTIWIETTDQGLTPNLRFVDVLVINITNINEKPINITLDNDMIPENSAVGTLVGILNVTDPDNFGSQAGSQSHTCSVLNADSYSYKVVSNTRLVVSKANLNFEGHPNQTIEIQCWDDDKDAPLYMDKFFTIYLSNVNERPIHLGISKTTIEENLGVGAELGILVAVEPDNEIMKVQNLTYEISPSNTTDVPFALVDGIVVRTTANLDYEKRQNYTFNFTATDTGVPMMQSIKTIVVQVIDENDPPTAVDLNSSGIPETAPIGTVIGILSTVDEDVGQTYTYKVLNFNNITNGSMFGIRGSELILLFEIDFETNNQWQVMIETTDDGQPPKSHMNLVIVNITNVNEAPEEIEIDYNMTVKEHSPVGAFVANMTVIDEDVNQTHTCYLMSGQKDFILINATIVGEQEITMEVAPNATLDYETTPDIWVTINCSDSGIPPLSITTSILVSLEDVNEPPTGIILTGNHTVPENSPDGYVVGDLSTIDQDFGQIYTYRIFGDASLVFDVDQVRSAIVVKNSINLNYEALHHPHFNMILETSDNGVPSMEYNQTLNITIVDINEPPTNVSLVVYGLYENSPSGAILGELTALNPEVSQTLTYSIMDTPPLPGPQPTFGVYSNDTGAYLQLANNSGVADASQYHLLVNVTDDGSPAEWTIGVVVIDVQQVDPCASGELTCGPNATCTRLNKTEGECRCNFGFTFNKDTGICLAVDNCHYPAAKSDPFSASAGLSTTVVSTGSTALQPICVNNATCTNLPNTYKCNCPPRFTGNKCEVLIDRCKTTASSCENGGKCIDTPTTMYCKCVPGYIGDTCGTDVNDCENVTCGAGTCLDGLNAFECSCPSYASGSFCQYFADACASATCKVGEQCAPRTISAINEALKEPAEFISVSEEGVERAPEISANYYCVPASDWSDAEFEPRGGEAEARKRRSTNTNTTYVTAAERKEWNDFVRSTPFSSNDEHFNYPDDVYMDPIPTVGGGISYIVVIHDRVIEPLQVATTLRASCNRTDITSNSKRMCGRWTDLEGKATPPVKERQESPTTASGPATHLVSNTMIWAIIGGAALLVAIVAAVATIKVYSGRKRKMKSAGPLSAVDGLINPTDDDDDDGIYSVAVAPTGEPVSVRNPLFHNPLYDVNDDAIHGTQFQNVQSDIYEGAGQEYDDPMDALRSLGSEIGQTISSGEKSESNSLYENL